MERIIPVLQTALPVFLALGLGMLCRGLRFLTRDGIDALKKVVLNITLPAVLLHAFAATEYTAATVMLPATVFLVCCVALLLGFGIIRLVRSKSRLTPFLASGFEAGMLGYALFKEAHLNLPFWIWVRHCLSLHYIRYCCTGRKICGLCCGI